MVRASIRVSWTRRHEQYTTTYTIVYRNWASEQIIRVGGDFLHPTPDLVFVRVRHVQRAVTQLKQLLRHWFRQLDSIFHSHTCYKWQTYIKLLLLTLLSQLLLVIMMLIVRRSCTWSSEGLCAVNWAETVELGRTRCKRKLIADNVISKKPDALDGHCVEVVVTTLNGSLCI